MTQKRKKRTVKKTSRGKKMSGQLRLLGGALFIIFMIISLHTESAGFLGRGLKNTLLTLFGLGGYVFPYFLIATTFFYFLKREKKEDFIRNMLAFSAIYIALLSLIDLTLYSPADYNSVIEKLASASQIGRTGFGGGLVGGLISYSTSALLGRMGSIILNLFMIVGILVYISDTDMAEIIKGIVEKIKNRKKKTGLKKGKSNTARNKSLKDQDKQKSFKQEFKIINGADEEDTQASTRGEDFDKQEVTLKMNLRDIEEASRGESLDFKTECDLGPTQESQAYRYPPLSFLNELREDNSGETLVAKKMLKS